MNLDSLVLTEEELEVARQQVRILAHHKWQQAGCPMGDSLRFWREAELEWIHREYVPDRALMICEVNQTQGR